MALKADDLELKLQIKPSLFEDIEMALALGYTYRGVAAAIGVTRQEFLQWIDRGRSSTSGPYYELIKSIERGEAKIEAYHVDVMRAASMNDWRASESFLKRRHRDDWGDNTSQQITGAGGGNLQVEVSYIDKVIDPIKNSELESMAEELAIEESIEPLMLSSGEQENA